MKPPPREVYNGQIAWKVKLSTTDNSSDHKGVHEGPVQGLLLTSNSKKKQNMKVRLKKLAQTSNHNHHHHYNNNHHNNDNNNNNHHHNNNNTNKKKKKKNNNNSNITTLAWIPSTPGAWFTCLGLAETFAKRKGNNMGNWGYNSL